MMRRQSSSAENAFRSARRRGFTLIELIAASVIAAVLAGAATMSIRRLADSRDRSAQRQAAMESVHSITRIIARDMANIVRDTTLIDTIVRIDDTTGSSPEQRDELLLFARSMRPVRPEQAEDGGYRESGNHEIHYRLKSDPQVRGVLWRRSDPIVDENYEGGGVAVPLGTHIVSLDFEAFNGTAWEAAWDSDKDGLPHALRVTCRGIVPQTGALVVARATVALDRIPLPFDPEVDETYDPSNDIWNLELGGSERDGNLFQFDGGAGGTPPPRGGGGGTRRRGDGGGEGMEFGPPRGGGGRGGQGGEFRIQPGQGQGGQRPGGPGSGGGGRSGGGGGGRSGGGNP